jgi:hypothetical protein
LEPPVEEIVRLFDPYRDAYVVEFWNKGELWADVLLDSQSASFNLTVYDSAPEAQPVIDLTEALHHLLDAQQYLLEGTISGLKNERGNATGQQPGRPAGAETIVGSPAKLVVFSDIKEEDEIVVALYGGDESWATIAFDEESASYLLIIDRPEPEGWLELDLTETMTAMLEAQQILMEYEVFELKTLPEESLPER